MFVHHGAPKTSCKLLLPVASGNTLNLTAKGQGDCTSGKPEEGATHLTLAKIREAGQYHDPGQSNASVATIEQIAVA